MRVNQSSDEELEISFKKCVANERKILHWVLVHIKEIDSRRLYAERGFDSMVNYLVKVHGYSNSAAEKRLYAARLLGEVPELSQKVESGALNLSQLGQVSSAIRQKERLGDFVITASEKVNLISLVEGKTSFEAQKVLSKTLDIPLKEPEKVVAQKDDSVSIQLTLSQRQYELLERCKASGFHTLHEWRSYSVASTIEMICVHFLKGKGADSEDTGLSMNSDNASITPRTRRFILERDKCCQYVDKKTGLICESKVGLQVDHIIPRWAGGDSALWNS